MKKVELLAPAGDLEKLKIAVEYGADAVYCGAPAFNLRAGAKNMSFSELKEGVAYAHSKGRKVYLTLNIYAHNEDIECLEAFMNNIQGISVDAFIVSDPGILHWLRKNYPNMDIHLSTQANTTNYLAADYWFKQGVKRIILAREMSLKEIAKLRNMVSPELELEAFVHGAMCISYSGRCLLSSFMTGRDSNRGKCAHPCRWNYYLEEEKRPGEYYPIFEDEKGSYILNSKDLCMIEYLPDMIEAGLDTLKIEGRNKSVFYVAATVGAYRKALDTYYSNPEEYKVEESWLEQLNCASHRLYTTGFYIDRPGPQDQNYETSQYERNYVFLGLIMDYDPITGIAVVEQRNKIVTGDEVEIFGPNIPRFRQKIDIMLNEENEPIDAAPHAQQIVKIRLKQHACQNSMVCKRI